MILRKNRLLLLVESRDLGEILKLALRDYDLDLHAGPGAAGDAFRRRSFDLAIIDLALDGRASGLDLIRQWREAGAEFPIIAISDLPQPSLVVESLDAGADDYLRMPFHHEEMTARIRKLLGRRGGGSPVRKAGGVLMSRDAFGFREVTVTPDLVIRFPDGAEEPIRPKHHGILQFFAKHAGGIAHKDQLIRTVWGSDGNEGGHSVNQYISTLRSVFARHGIDFNLLVASEPKVGWRIHASVAEPPPPPAP